ncbi:hypothetical protein IGI04_022072 [Brassica rapa subsp. trilocularis]|nr:hypothetical protein IGI04_022072 [Brassica rapa subsp. trilocularis]
MQKKHVWSPKNFLAPLSYYERNELVYVPERFCKSFYIIYYDLKRNKFHRVEYKGIAEDESRLKNGLVKSRLFNIHIVSNHIEGRLWDLKTLSMTMDRQQETTEQIHKKARTKSQESVVRSSFPLDLISEILSKLPAKSVGRFRCVSKLWSSVTTDPYFLDKFETQSRQKKPSLLVTFKRDDRLFVFSIPQDRQSSNEYHSIASQPVHSYHMTYPKSRRFFPRVSVHGLISCFQEETKPIIWNPTTRKLLTLTKPEKSWDYATFFLGYDPVDAKHKVLCMRFDETMDEYRVFALGSGQESWRRIKTSHKHYVNSYPTRHVCTNGFIYYKAYSDKTERFGFIMSFDVRSEEFHVIKLPCNNSRPGGILASYEGRLACVTHNTAGDGTILWTLMDAEKHEWSRRDFPIPIPFYDRSLETAFNFIGITDAGEFVYVPNRFRKLYYVLYYDPKRNKFHRVGFNGIADDESRLKHGLVNSRLYNIPVVMNHIESLMSF